MYVYDNILNKVPELKHHGFGHTSDPVSQTVLSVDLDMLDFCTGAINVVLTSGIAGCYCYIPVTYINLVELSFFFRSTVKGCSLIEFIYCIAGIVAFLVFAQE